MKNTLFFVIIAFLFIILLLWLAFNCEGSREKGTNDKTEVENQQKDSTSCQLAKPIYNIYIENSVSMNGYVKGVTEFEQSIYGYLSDIEISNLTDSLNLFYINSKIIPQGNDIADFIEKLEPASFAKKGGDIGVTDISGIIKSTLGTTKKNMVSILVSDFIFSPGKGKDAEQYLVNQQIGIKNSVAEHLQKYMDHAIIVYQLESKFEGQYYNREDKPAFLSANRPFYIWTIGHANYLKDLMTKCPESKFKGSGVKNTFSMMQGGRAVNYAVQHGSGNFKLDRKSPKNTIVNAQKDAKGVGDKKMRFSVNIDFSGLLCDESTLTNPDNYSLNDKDYQLEVVKYNKSGDFTHTLKLSTDIVKPTTLTIKVKSSVPEWVEECNDADGMTLKSDNMNKTFGIKYLIGGVYEAFTNDGEYYTDIKINVNK